MKYTQRTEMNKPVIIIDMDDTIAETTSTWQARLKEKYGVDPVKEITEYNMKKFYPTLTDDQVYGIIREPDFFRILPPIEGAQEAIQDFISRGWDVRLGTVLHPDTKHGYVAKLEWVEEYLPDLAGKTIVFGGHDKTLIWGNILVDDHPKHIEGFRGEIPIIFDRPWNRELEKRLRATNWKEAHQYIVQYMGYKGF